MKLKHHTFRFGLIGNLKVLLCRIFGHRVLIDEAGLSPAHQGDTCPSCGAPDEEAFGGG